MDTSGSVLLGFIISAIDAAIFMPQAYRAWKYRNDAVALRGISATTMWIVIVAYSGWLVWDAWTGRWDAHAYAWIGLPAATLILVIVYRSQRLKNISNRHVCESCGQTIAKST